MMVRARLSAVAAWLMASSMAWADQPKLEEVLRSINQSTRGDSNAVDFKPFVLLIIAGILLYVAVKHWNSRQMTPRKLSSHSKLLRESASAAGVSHRKLRSLESLAKAQGLSSPLVAILCPSAITELARNVKTDAERQAVIELAQEVLKP